MVVSKCCEHIMDHIDFNNASYYVCINCNKACGTKILTDKGEKNAIFFERIVK
jgi:hypothetical protein